MHVEVRDQGVGFDAYGADQESTGGGFGLSSVKEQISRLGGQVAIASAAGKGTRVSILVPLKTDKAKTLEA